MKSWSDYLLEIEEREQKATPGPWRFIHTGSEESATIQITSDLIAIVPENRNENVSDCYICISEANSKPGDNFEFIEFSRTDIPRLTKRIRELERALEFYANGCLYSEPAAEKMIAREVLNRGVDE